MNKILGVLSATAICAVANAGDKPNFIVILTDDQGYGDIGCFGANDIATPNIDAMARGGIKLTSFYAAPVCAPSRAQLMTGSYSERVSHSFNPIPHDTRGLHPNEITVAELLKKANYSTKLIGKWHLGDHEDFLPRKQGFDEFFGIPYSNDMWPYYYGHKGNHPRLKEQQERAKKIGYSAPKKEYNFPDMPLMRDDVAIEVNPDQTYITKRYTEDAKDFISRNKEKPFFLYLAHAMPHIPLFVSERFRGKSKRGLYGDVVMELDWSCGEIVEHLKTLGLDKNTLIIFTSDNGPWLRYNADGGSNGPLREGKASTYEGGVRVPTVAYWPGKIPAGQETDLITGNIDILPTFAKLAGVELPKDRVIDGRDIMPVLTGQSKVSPHRYYYSHSRNIPTIRNERYKLKMKLKKGAKKGSKVDPKLFRAVELYDLKNDVGESKNIIKNHPEIAQDLFKQAKKIAADLMKNARPLGVAANPKPPKIDHLPVQ